MFTSIISLVTMTQVLSATGDMEDTYSKTKDVYCRVVSANEKEKTFADTRGYGAELVFILADMVEYNGELFVDYNGVRYRVVDTKFSDTSEEIRLVVTKWLNK